MVDQLSQLTFKQLSRAAAIQAKIEGLEKELALVLGQVPTPTSGPVRGRGRSPRRKRVISAEGKARIAAAQKLRWAKARAAKKGK